METPINFHALGARFRSTGDGPIARSSLLLILDLHGVLVQRVRLSEKRIMTASKRQRKPWRRIAKHDIWQRPNLHDFFSLASARHTLAIWSAAHSFSIIPLIEALSDDVGLSHPPLKNRLFFVSDRSSCRPDPKSGRFAVVKYLPDFWNQFEQFSDRNTLIVEDTLSKIRFNLLSAVVVPEYNVDNYRHTFNDDDTLLWLLLYVEYLIEASALESNGVGIAVCRPHLYSFEAFWSIGFREACQIASEDQRRNLKSLAYVFLPDPSHNEVRSPAELVTSSQGERPSENDFQSSS